MKQLTCEMCGSTELVKQDGFFLCQTCGTKYSVEEAKKMMVEGTVEVQGYVNVQNAAQVDNLYKLAISSFESKNYAQAENFCNQIISIDSNNYDAWKLKGEAINYQISSKNPRILEVYNCIMTSFRILDDETKKQKKSEVLSSLCVCLEGEIDYWLMQLEALRPSDEITNKVKVVFLDCAIKMTESLNELGFSPKDAKFYNDYLRKYFSQKVFDICVDLWENTVYYNYYRGGFTDEYHPDDDIWNTFRNEARNLCGLLEFCLDRCYNSITPELRVKYYISIIYWLQEVLKTKSYKRMISTTKNGLGIVVNEYEYWEGDSHLTQKSIESYEKVIESYKDKIEKTYEEIDESLNIEDLLNLAKQHLNNQEPTFASYRYKNVIKKEPTCTIAYLGLAVAIIEYGGQVTNAIEQINLSAKQTTIINNKDYLNFLLNYKCGDSKRTLLAFTCDKLDYNASSYLIKLGADVNALDVNGTTPLWKLASFNISSSNPELTRQLAKLLIDHNAKLNITSKDGRALYNNHTDVEIAKMIRQKDSTIQKGYPNNKGCYVATCVYGSYDCPEVWTLRRYRDDTLGSTWYGRLFIRTYYAISPTLVKWFGKTNWFKKLWKGKLDRMVAKLQAKGVEDTPYEDKNW